LKQTIFLFIIITFLYSNQEGIFNILHKDINKVTILFESEEIRTEKLDNYDQFIGYKTLTIDDGLPELPKYTLNYGLDPSKNYEISYNIINSHTINDVNIFPHQSVKKSNSEEALGIYVNSLYYNSHDTFPQEIIKDNRAMMRGNEIMMIDIIPFSYSNSNKTLVVYDEIEIIIEEIEDKEVVLSNFKRSKTFQNIYDNIVLDTFDDREIDFQEPSILYICGGGSSNSSINYAYLDSLIDWRRKQGYQVTAVDLAEIGGNTTTYVKNYIEDAYYNWENPPEFISLIGDASGWGSVPTVPTFTVGSGNGWSGVSAESDLPYVLIDDDLLADMLIGRISIRSETEFSVVANKILGYEKLYAGLDWIESVALVGDPYDSGISTVITNEYIAMIMENYGVEDINEQYSGSNTFDNFMVDQLNQGISFLNYRGFYGFSNFDEDDINQLYNGFKLPFLTTLTCGTGSFESETSCDSEDLLRAGTVNNPKGAVAVVATAQSYTHTAFNNIVTMGMYSGIFLYGAKTAGEALAYGELALALAYPQNPNDNVYHFSAWNNLMGDAATLLWTDTPKILIADHVENISMGTDNIVNVLVIDENENPVEGANVNLNLGDIYINGETGVDGNASILINDFNGQSGTVDVTATCHDCLFSETSFLLNQSSIFPEVDNSTLSFLEINFLNNNNNLINPGEDILVSFNVSNNTGENLEDLNIQINSSDTYLSSENIITISEIDSGDTFLVEGLILNIPPTILPDSEPLFFVNISGNNSSLESNQFLDLEIYSGTVSLHALGNFFPGIITDFNIELYNSGEINFTQLHGEILYGENDLFFETETILWNDISTNSSSLTSSIQLSTADDIINGSIFNIPVRVFDDYTFEQIVNLQLTIGNVSVTDPLGPDSYGYYIFDELDIDYDLAPSYSWIEIVPSQGGDGYQLDLNDNGNNQDDVTTIDLPFTFTFYGEDYDEVSVCSNGWISFGESDLESFYNYPLPGTGGPSPMVAVFWDDLEDGDVYGYYDEENDRFIIEWYNFDTYHYNANEEFQVILYNTGSQTPTGDDEILLQYRDFNNTSVGSYPVGNYSGDVFHGQYTSVGIEDHTGLIGLEYTFNNQYPEAAATLSDQSALFITTRTSSLYAQPDIDFSSSSFNFILEPDESTSEILSIANSGEVDSYLTYSLTVSPFVNQQSIVDDGGYAWSLSDVDEYIDYDWVDISDDNITLEIENNDQSPGYFNIGFDFPFYGTNYSEILINPNGWVGFGEDNDEWDNQGIFEDGSPRNAILGYWDDLNPVSDDNSIGEGYIRYHSNDDRMVIWYDDVIHWTSNQIYCDFQIILYSSGQIAVNYRSIEGVSNDGATIGIINADGNIGQEIPFDELNFSNQLSLLYKFAPDWISLSQDEGGLGYGSTDNIIINIDMQGYDSGNYTSYIILESNASANIIIPIEVQIEAFLLGDLNTDGEIDILDVVRLVTLILNYDGTSYELIVSDLNEDGDVNIMDIILLVQIILN